MTTKSFFFFIALVAVLFSSCEKQEIEDITSDSSEEAQLKSSYTLSNWMGSLGDDLSISEISIPGAHDAGALYEPWPGTAICQDLTIGEQLEAGIRFLDIRCRHIEDAFAIHHGSIYQHMNFDDVLEYCWDFLSDYPTECIVMSVKEEYDSEDITETFEETFDNYVAKNDSGWYLGETVPDLGSVRGKIVLFRRFSASSTPKGISAYDWQDDTTFVINNDSSTIKVQDDYNVSDNDEKWEEITSLLEEANSGSSSTLYVNFTSGYESLIFGIPCITSVSDEINPLITSYFTDNTSGWFGILPMDFVNEERNALIVETNF
jgi:1-phosphatidylinositol phosphodiesterase